MEGCGAVGTGFLVGACLLRERERERETKEGERERDGGRILSSLLLVSKLMILHVIVIPPSTEAQSLHIL